MCRSINQKRIGNRLKLQAMFFAIAFNLSPATFAQSGAQTAEETNIHYIQASRAQSVQMLSNHIDYYIDSSWQKTAADMEYKLSNAFTPIQTLTPNFGFTKDRIWLRIRAENTTQKVNKWYLHVHENFLQYYDVYVLREDKSIDHLESHNLETAFSDRTVIFPELATEFDFRPQEKITIFIAYSSGGSSNISLSLETNDSFQLKSISKTSKNFGSYGMMMILIVMSGLALLILRLRVFWYYLIYVVVTLLFLMHSDGVAFQYFWPNFPGFNAYFSIIIGLAFSVVPYSFARVFLRTKEFHPKTDKFMATMVILSFIVIIPSAILNPQLAKKLLMLMILLALIMGTLAGMLAAQTRFREVRFYLFAWILGVISASYMNMRHFLGIDVGQDIELDSIRVGILVDAVMMGLGVADRYTQELKARRLADKQNLEQAQMNLSLNNRLQGLEEQYRLASELSASRDQDIQNTVHDIRAPLHALRLNLKTLERNGSFSQNDTADIDETFSYLESLIADQLRQSIARTDEITEPGSRYAVANNDDLSLSNILKSVWEMFFPEAEAKGLEFRYVETQAQTNVDALALMRIVTNLISNAIKYTPDGKILLGVRRKGRHLHIEVHDTGPGLSDDEFLKAQKRTVRLGETPDDKLGNGYGLSIARELVDKYGLTLSILPNRECGTSVVLSIPSILDS